MSWFGLGGGSKKEEEPQPMSIDDFHGQEFNSSSQSQYSAPRSLGGGSNNFEQELMLEQQKAMIQAVMLKLTDAAFDVCVTKPSSSLSSSEQTCISAVVGKYLETSELIVRKMNGDQQH